MTRRQLLAAAAVLPSLPLSYARHAAAMTEDPFHISIPEAVLARVMDRVRSAHRPRTAEGAGWKYGVDADWFANLLDYWGGAYDWRAAERGINALPQFRATIGGRRQHFAHIRSRNPRATPLLLLHGWPYSFWSFSEVTGLATDFHLVIPSLPGSHFSDPVADAPRGLRMISQRIHALMTRVLGYERYFVQGSDHGAVVADWLALDHAGAILGEQTNLLALRHKGAEYASGETGVADPTPAERAFVADEARTFKAESAYFELQRTRPETIAWAMADSPVGAAAYMLDKWQKWSDLGERPLDEIHGRDRLLTEVMLYLLTDSFATSIWTYAGFMLEPFSIPEGRVIEVPYGFSGYPDPLNAPPPREFAARSRTRIVQWEVAGHGGHFPFLENPARFVASFGEFAEAALDVHARGG